MRSGVASFFMRDAILAQKSMKNVLNHANELQYKQAKKFLKT